MVNKKCFALAGGFGGKQRSMNLSLNGGSSCLIIASTSLVDRFGLLVVAFPFWNLSENIFLSYSDTIVLYHAAMKYLKWIASK